MRKVAVIFLTSLFLFLFPSVCRAATYVVPDNYSTISSAYEHASSNDVIIVRAGIYHERLILNKSHIIIRAEQKWQAILDGSNSIDSLVFISGAYNTVEGFEIKNGNHGGIDVYGNYNQILNNNIHHNGNGNPSYGYGQDGVYSERDMTGNIYKGNFIHHNGRITGCTPDNLEGNCNLDHGFYLCGDNELVANNIITYNSAYGIHIAGYTTVSNLKIYNNTVAFNGRSGAIVWQDLDGIDIRNNIFYNNTNYGIDYYAPTNSTGRKVNIDHNMFYGNPSGTIHQNSIFNIASNLTNNPNFVSDNDFHLKSGSPAINAGTSIGAPSTDFDGTTRPQPPGGMYDIGAYEYGSSGGGTLTPTPTRTPTPTPANKTPTPTPLFNAVTYHVAKNCTGISNCYTNPQSVADIVSPGDTVLIHEGTYSSFTISRSGQENKYITFKNYPGEHPVISGGSYPIYISVWPNPIGWIILEGLEVANAGADGIKAEQAHHIIIRNCDIHNNYGNNIYFTGGQYNTIDRNRLHENGNKQADRWHGHSIYATGQHFTVTNNLFYAGGCYGLQMAAYNQNSCGWCSGLAPGYDSIEDWTIANNVFAQEKTCSGIVIWDGYGGTTNNVRIYNNIFQDNNYQNSGGRPNGIQLLIENGGPIRNVNIHDNIYYGSNVFIQSGGGGQYTESNNTNANPLFVRTDITNPSNNDFHLRYNSPTDKSPAINAGTSIGALDHDFDGFSRPWPAGGKFDIGAYEYIASGSLSPTPSACLLASSGDFNCDNLINESDLNALLGKWMTGEKDITGDAIVNESDLNKLLGNWKI